MIELNIPATTKTPRIHFSTSGTLSITGNSYPEDVITYYNPILNWVELFLENYFEPVSLKVDLGYVNTSSVKCLLQIITKVGSMARNEVKVNWVHEIDDDDMLSLGEDLERMSGVKFEYSKK
jgi:hypothetical protein